MSEVARKTDDVGRFDPCRMRKDAEQLLGRQLAGVGQVASGLLPDLGLAARQRLIGTIQPEPPLRPIEPADDPPSGRAAWRLLWSFTLLCLMVLLASSLLMAAVEVRQDIRETRRLVE